MSQLGFEPILGSYLAVALLALGLVALLLIGPTFGALSRPRRMTLLVLRLIVIFLAILALLRPTWVTTVRTPRPSVLLLLADVSRSMQLPSGRSEQSRWRAQANALAESSRELARLAGRNQTEVRAYAYDYKLRPLEISGGKLSLPESPTGEQTDIGTTLHDALRAEQGKRLMAVFVLGDGSQNAFDPLVETQDAARKLRDDFAAPLFAVTFGLSGSEAQARDVAVERLDEQFTVFVKNELVVRAILRVRGYVKQDLPVELLLTDDKGQSQPIGRRTIRADEDNQQVEVEFLYTPQTPGHFKLTVAADPQAGELVTKNNRLDAYLTVLEGGLRVLYLDGEKRFEQKFLRRAINASPDIELDDRIIDRRSEDKWPVDLGRDFAENKYDAFILGDLDAAALGPENLKVLADAVGTKRKGLLMIGGRTSFGRGHYLNTLVGDALPITIDRLEGQEFANEENVDKFFLPGPLPLVPAAQHAITRLAPDAENVAVWSKLPPLNWANKFYGLKETMPGLRVLLETPQKQPLLVSGEYGKGRTLAFAGESTYLWPLHGFEKEHKRFWRQVILWLVRRDDLNRDDVWIKLDQRRLSPGTRAIVEAGARTGAGDPIKNARMETFLIRPGNKKEKFDLSQDD
ncbi:MAG TPA: glutamine amidotransferase, partial [Pirellulaceae bacterium]|nr:glutamine amidotransferase [Pirellulaceae bacterium]